MEYRDLRQNSRGDRVIDFQNSNLTSSITRSDSNEAPGAEEAPHTPNRITLIGFLTASYYREEWALSEPAAIGFT
jgi:hypothetical protein